MDGDRIADVRFTAASVKDVERGLLAWVSCTLNGTVRLNGLTLRRTRRGRLAIAFPVRLDARGRKHAVVQPINSCARKMIERAIIAQIENLEVLKG